MVELTQILQFFKVDPSTGWIQSAILFMILLSSNGVRRDIKMLLVKIDALEIRVFNLETKTKEKVND